MRERGDHFYPLPHPLVPFNLIPHCHCHWHSALTPETLASWLYLPMSVNRLYLVNIPFLTPNPFGQHEAVAGSNWFLTLRQGRNNNNNNNDNNNNNNKHLFESVLTSTG